MSCRLRIRIRLVIKWSVVTHTFYYYLMWLNLFLKDMYEQKCRILKFLWLLVLTQLDISPFNLFSIDFFQDTKENYQYNLCTLNAYLTCSLVVRKKQVQHWSKLSLNWPVFIHGVYCVFLFRKISLRAKIQFLQERTNY